MNILRIHVDHETLTAQPERPLVAGSVGVVKFTADFDESWEAYARTVIFAAIRYDSAVSRMVLYTGGEMEVPWEVLEEPGFLKISAVGSGADGQRQPTARMGEGLVIQPCGERTGGDPERNTPELWEQALDAAGEAVRTAQAVQAEVSRVAEMGDRAQAAADAAAQSAARAQASADALGDLVIQAGAVRQVAGVGPDGTGNVPLTAADLNALSGTDTFLTAAGVAADAKAVGEKFLHTEEALEQKLGSAGGRMTGALDMGGQLLFGLPEPGEGDQAATKGYVDGKKRTLSLTVAADRFEGTSLILEAPGVTEDAALVAAPNPDSLALWGKCGLRCTAQGQDTVTLAWDRAPGADVTVNILILS